MAAKPKITYGDNQLLGRYEAPQMFPLFYKYKSDPYLLRSYVEGEIAAMVADGSLYLTDILGQTGEIRDYIGRLIAGVDIDPDTRREVRAEPLPPEILAHKITVEVIKGRAETVKFKSGKKPVPYDVATKSGSIGHVGPDPDAPGRVIRMPVDVWVDYGEPSAQLPLAEAWTALRQLGEHCNKQGDAGERRKKRFWKFREVRPRKGRS